MIKADKDYQRAYLAGCMDFLILITRESASEVVMFWSSMQCTYPAHSFLWNTTRNKATKLFVYHWFKKHKNNILKKCWEVVFCSFIWCVHEYAIFISADIYIIWLQITNFSVSIQWHELQSIDFYVQFLLWKKACFCLQLNGSLDQAPSSVCRTLWPLTHLHSCIHRANFSKSKHILGTHLVQIRNYTETLIFVVHVQSDRAKQKC